jgi:hypothetical protein
VLPGLKDHRTDGRNWRSTARRNFDVGGLFETQGLVAHIDHLESHFDHLSQVYIAEINFLAIQFEFWSATYFNLGSGPIGIQPKQNGA